LLAENEETEYIAYVSEQNLLADDLDLPVNHPQINEIFGAYDRGQYQVLTHNTH
ncbi:MAG: heat shock protein HspQ, partial [Pseudomonadota bacterium]|nr:heat shock protein HspQ [Pseudomonadota bacterium]MEC8210553.1 heat shock protein HspQ [Pseudomonadota bacterium]